MGGNLLTNNPFAILTFIAAPAILTNATSVLAMSTINRMLRTRDRMHELFRESEKAANVRNEKFIEQVNRVERQAMLLLNALHWIYVALGAFAAASLVTLLGGLFGQLGHETLIRVIIGAGLLLGFVGVTGLVGGCVNLFRATQLSLVNIREEADLIRARQARQKQDGPAAD
jgi:VIT1/CCC1 family predicted Fe2+/Mn2+ transporter